MGPNIWWMAPALFWAAWFDPFQTAHLGVTPAKPPSPAPSGADRAHQPLKETP